MRKVLFMVCSLVLIVAIAGCAGARVYKFSKERVDTEVAGNQGVIYGPTPMPHRVATPNRELYGVDIELTTMSEVKTAVKSTAEAPTEDKGVSGNAGRVSEKIK